MGYTYRYPQTVTDQRQEILQTISNQPEGSKNRHDASIWSLEEKEICLHLTSDDRGGHSRE